MFNARPGVRARILAIALVPSLVLLVIGVGASGYLVERGRHAEEWAAAMQATSVPSIDFVRALQLERQLTIARFAGDGSVTPALAAARSQLDSSIRTLFKASAALVELGLVEVQSEGDFETNTGLLENIAKARVGIDAGVMSALDVYRMYNQLGNIVTSGTRLTMGSAPDAEISSLLSDSRAVLYTSESLARASAVGAAIALSEEPFAVPLEDFQYEMGLYHTQITNLASDTDFSQRERLQKLMQSPAWQQVTLMENALVQRSAAVASGARTTSLQPLPMSIPEWQAAATQLNNEILDVYNVQFHNAHGLAVDVGKNNASNSAWAGAGVLLVSILAFLIALLLANRVIRRLKRLRNETLTLANERLPDLLRRLRNGETVDPATESGNLDFGTDEIGEVATAFEQAHNAAVEGAVNEARTREGVKLVFLNIAHRSQIVVHRQLEILDEAENQQEDPALLETLFRLDHLATRERRNAENLIILGGGQPGRQWRNPVPLMDLVRSSVGETLDYARVRVARLPEAYIVGTVVADLIHLLAELVDNATTFSPPQSKVEIAGNVVGKGVVLEISDQGMGMPEAELTRVNDMLRNPPDFGVATLSADSRLGLFVVAQLALRNDVSVRLSESDYGGIRAIVLLPTTLLASGGAPGLSTPSAGQLDPRRQRHITSAADSAGRPVESESTVLTAAPPVALPAPVPEPAAPPSYVPPSYVPQSYTPQSYTPQAPPQAPPPPVAQPPQVQQPYAPPSYVPQSQPYAPPAQPQEQPAQPQAQPLGPDGRPALPRRSRQASLNPELAKDPTPTATHQVVERERSAEQARDLMSAIENGTRQGRRAQLADDQEQEGDDRSQNR
ncbi:nitrate- and nitrite sensing domain-containing protein [Nocardia sp. NBC_01377]|uniref:sensor histidine kinase n=1 Tax=Nocardia sp. NBC_01377 TaxID=2903595 RepID=UPI00386DD712